MALAKEFIVAGQVVKGNGSSYPGFLITPAKNDHPDNPDHPDHPDNTVGLECPAVV